MTVKPCERATKWHLIGVVILITVSYLAVTLSHVCAGEEYMRLPHTQETFLIGVDHEIPCAGAKEDICKSVRDQMLSLPAPLPLSSIVTSLPYAYLPIDAAMLDPKTTLVALGRSGIRLLQTRPRRLFLSQLALRI